MGRIRFILLLLLCFTSFYANENNEPLLTIPLLDSEIEYDIQIMFDAQKDFPENDNSYEYSKVIIKREQDFLKTCSIIDEADIDKSTLGYWYLRDKEGNLIKNHSYYLNEIIQISIYNSNITFDNWGNRSYLYKGINDRVYIFSRWINIIRLIRFIDNRIYVYIVNNGKWILDPIHQNGKYFFTKQL